MEVQVLSFVEAVQQGSVHESNSCAPAALQCRREHALQSKRLNWCEKDREGKASMGARRWQDWANLVLGAWLFVSPWALSYDGIAAWNAHGVGVGVVVFALTAAYVPKA